MLNRADHFVDALRDELTRVHEAVVTSVVGAIQEMDPSLGEAVKGVSGTGTRMPAPVGEIVDNFLVLRQVGVGGMGEVYLAADIKLRRFVALKILNATRLRTPVSTSRLLQEARATSRLDHPNIASLFQVGESEDGRAYIAMAFCPGETPGEMLRAGKTLDPDLIQSVARQTLMGLEHAHAAHVIHRDIKPANLMIGPDGTLRILDFGIAKHPTGDLTAKGKIIGTPAYMSPEQLQGEPVDGRTDIWALGVTLYELVSGAKPFDSAYPQAVMYSIIHEEPEPLRERCPDADPTLTTLIEKCLAKAPANRFQSASEALRFLDAVGTHEVEHAVYPWKRAWTVLLVVALLGFAAWFASGRLDGAVQPPGEANTRLAVLPFRSLNVDEDDRVLADGLTESVTSMAASRLAGSPGVWLVPSAEIRRRGVLSSAEARRVFNVNTVLTGSVQVVAGSLELSLTLADPTGPRTLDSRTVRHQNDQFRDSIEVALTGLLGQLDPTEVGPVEPPVSSAAYLMYLRGIGYLHRAQDPASQQRAAFFFEEALTIQPGYALALAGSCELSVERYRTQREASWFEAALSQCAEALRSDPSRSEVRVTQARLLFEGGRYREAEEEIGEAIRLDSTNSHAFRWLGRILEDRGQRNGAEEAYKAAIRLDPDLMTNYDELGGFFLYQGKNDEAASAFRHMIRLAPEYHDGYNALAAAQRNLGHLDSARAAYGRALEIQPNPLSHRGLGSLSERQRDFRQATTDYRLAVALDSADVWNWALLANALYWSRRLESSSVPAGDEFERAVHRIKELATARLAINPRDDDALILRTFGMGLEGDYEAVRRSLLDLLSVPLKNDYSFQYVGRILETIGEREMAIVHVDAALGAGLGLEVVEADPWFDALRSSTGYRQVQSRILN